jgi:site-specific recombinase XerD
METVLDIDQLQKLYDCLVKELNDLNIICSKNEISTDKLDNNSLIKQFVATKRLENLSEKSIQQYARAITRFFQVINKPYYEVNSLNIKFYLSMYASTGVSNVTVNNEKRFISAFFSWLSSEDYISKNPALSVKNIKCKEIKKTNLTDDDVEKIRDVCENKKELAIIDTLASTGVRVSELVSLNRDSVDFESGCILVYASKTKSYRTVYLTPRAKNHLSDYLKSRSDNFPALFLGNRNSRITPPRVEKTIQSLCKKANINKRVTVHTFRRYLASQMFRRGCDLVYVSKLLGHSSTSTTEKFYLVVNQDKIKDAHSIYVA